LKSASSRVRDGHSAKLMKGSIVTSLRSAERSGASRQPSVVCYVAQIRRMKWGCVMIPFLRDSVDWFLYNILEHAVLKKSQSGTLRYQKTSSAPHPRGDGTS
jgi:hypothetical protein